jgi:hypothetical protein
MLKTLLITADAQVFAVHDCYVTLLISRDRRIESGWSANEVNVAPSPSTLVAAHRLISPVASSHNTVRMKVQVGDPLNWLLVIRLDW